MGILRNGNFLGIGGYLRPSFLVLTFQRYFVWSRIFENYKNFTNSEIHITRKIGHFTPILLELTALDQHMQFNEFRLS